MKLKVMTACSQNWPGSIIVMPKFFLSSSAGPPFYISLPLISLCLALSLSYPVLTFNWMCCLPPVRSLCQLTHLHPVCTHLLLLSTGSFSCSPLHCSTYAWQSDSVSQFILGKTLVLVNWMILSKTYLCLYPLCCLLSLRVSAGISVFCAGFQDSLPAHTWIPLLKTYTYLYNTYLVASVAYSPYIYLWNIYLNSFINKLFVFTSCIWVHLTHPDTSILIAYHQQPLTDSIPNLYVQKF